MEDNLTAHWQKWNLQKHIPAQQPTVQARSSGVSIPLHPVRDSKYL